MVYSSLKRSYLLKKLLILCASALLASALWAQESITETVNNVTITFPSTFTLTANNDTSLSLTKDDGTSVNFALPEELNRSFGITAGSGTEAFDELVATLISFGAKTPEGAITELTINNASAPVKKFNLDGEEIYLGVMTLPDGSWALIGFSAVFDKDTALLESIYGSIQYASAASSSLKTETINGITVTFPANFEVEDNDPNTFTLNDGENSINFARAIELVETFAVTAEDADDAFDKLMISVSQFAEEAPGGIESLTINDTVAPVRRFTLPDGEFYFGIMTLKDGSWGIIGFSTIYETQTDLLEGIYNSLVISDVAAQEPDLGSISGALRPSEMPAGKFVMFGAASNIVFDLPEGLKAASDDPVFESATFFGDMAGSNVTVFTVDTTFMALETFLESYISTLAASVSDMGFSFGESVVVSEGEDGITRYSYQAPATEGAALTATVEVLALTDSTGVIVQGVGMSRDKNIAAYVTTISQTMRLVERSASAEPPAETPTSPELSSAQDVTCSSRGYDVISTSVSEALVRCPLGCTNSNSASIWGTDIYTDDSAICIAAIHAGVLTAEGGVVKVIRLDGQSSYLGTERNGISTSNYGSWGASFSLEKP